MRLLCVAPRYGEQILGGAETLMRGFAEQAHAAGIETHVLTTCAVDVDLQINAHLAGRSLVNGVPTWRYPVEPLRDRRRQRQLLFKWMTAQPMTPDEEDEWLHLGPHSPRLYAHLQQYGPRYDAILFAPYVFPLVQYAASLYPQRSVIWPCLHDEALARAVSTRLMLSQSLGIIYNSEPEHALARHKLRIDHPRSVVAGVGVDDFASDAARFRQRFNLHAPFILYAGRLEPPKNVLLLLDYFLEYKRRPDNDLHLVLLGEGPVAIPSHPHVHALGFQPEQDKHDACAAAMVVCQPSVMESFSLVIMEAWLAGTPVLVHGDCDVTRFHVLHSGGGLYFSTPDEFAGTLDWFTRHSAVRSRMGQLGRVYVLREYSWKAVLGRAMAAIRQWLNEV